MSVPTIGMVDLIIAVVMAAAASAATARILYRKALRRQVMAPSGEIQMVRTERHPVTLRASRRIPAQVYLDLAARYGKHPETLGLWMAEKMIAADAGKLAELARVTVDRDPVRDEYVFQLTLMVVPADKGGEDHGED